MMQQWLIVMTVLQAVFLQELKNASGNLWHAEARSSEGLPTMGGLIVGCQKINNGLCSQEPNYTIMIVKRMSL